MELETYSIIGKPVITEKSFRLMQEEQKYTFEVNPRSHKIQIKHAFEKVFSVKVAKISVIKGIKKKKKRGKYQGMTAAQTKVIVKLKPGYKLNVFEEEKYMVDNAAIKAVSDDIKAISKSSPKSTAKKTVETKPTTKKTTVANSTVKKTVGTKPAAKKTTVPKPAAKKTTAAKPVTKKTVGTKPAAKKTTAAKPVTKKTVAAAPAVKKTAVTKPASKSASKPSTKK